jgi:hypothetical protein
VGAQPAINKTAAIIQSAVKLDALGSQQLLTKIARRRA